MESYRRLIMEQRKPRVFKVIAGVIGSVHFHTTCLFLSFIHACTHSYSLVLFRAVFKGQNLWICKLDTI